MGKALRFVVGFMLVVAACGGDADENGAPSTATPAGDGTSTTAATTAAPTTAAPTTTTSAAPSATSSDDFCEFIIAYAAQSDFSPIGLSPEQVEESLTTNLAAINQAAELASPEIQGDVLMFADAYGGFVELLAESDFNYLAMANVDPDDPRLTALENPELEEAGERIEAYCGIDNFIATAPPTPAPPDAPDSGGGGISTGGELPSGFPTELVPEGAEIVVALDAQGVASVTYDVAMTTDEVVAFYEGLLGAATAELTEPRGALWITAYEGSSLTVTVAETDVAITQVNVSLG